MLLYVSGSSMNKAIDLFTDDVTGTQISEPFQYGKRMGALEIDSDEASVKDFRTVSHNFNSDLTGDANVQFRVVSGKWNISDVSVRPAADTGFSPAFIQFKQELPAELQHKRPETLEFLTEFYDINNNIADEIAFTTGSVFTGANIVISGNDNIQSGDMFLGGDTTGSGIHFGGVDSKLPETGKDGADADITELAKKVATLQQQQNLHAQQGFFDNMTPMKGFLFAVAMLYLLTLLAGASGSIWRNFKR